MRPLEIAITATVLPYTLYLLSPSRGESPWFAIFPLLAVLLTLLHLVVEGFRWQMIPGYAVVLFLLACVCVQWILTVRVSYLAGGAALVSLLGAIALCTTMPVFKLPAPTGPLNVGTQVRHLIDESRRDPHSDNPFGPRELMIQIWYPADATSKGQVAPYRDKRITTLADAQYALVDTHSLLEVPMSYSHARYPVVLFTPSWSGIRTESTFQIEQLASHGYIVIGIDHTYSARITVFPDGRIARKKFAGDIDFSSAEAVERFRKTATEQVELRALDAQFVLEALERLNAGDPYGLLTGRLDLARVGIFGFSLGGGVAAEACRLDSRFKAGVDMDGLIAGEAAKGGTVAPFFFMLSGEDPIDRIDIPLSDAAQTREVEFEVEQVARMKQSLHQYGGYLMRVPGMIHGDFSDAPFTSISRNRAPTRERFARTVSEYLLAFFDKHLKGMSQILLDGPSTETSEVRFEVWRK